MAEAEEHPLTRTQHTSAFTVAALFWGVGVTMIDPRIGIGALLCVIGISGTLWLYSGDLRRMPQTPYRKWPWIALLFISIEIFVPGYLLYVRAYDGAKNLGVTATGQNGGQSGNITNQGPVYNGPLLVRPQSSLDHPCKSTGIHIEDSSSVTMEDNLFEGIDCPIDAHGSNNVRAKGNIAK